MVAVATVAIAVPASQLQGCIILIRMKHRILHLGSPYLLRRILRHRHLAKHSHTQREE